MSGFVSRGFTPRRRSSADEAARLPPGQYAEPGFPVLTAGPTPHVASEDWKLRIDGMVANGREWNWEQFHELPFEDVPCDIHCVTKWSKLGTSFGGVSVDVLLDGVEPKGGYTTVYSYGGYTTNLQMADITRGKAWVVTQLGGRAPQRRARRSCTPAGAAPVLLEEREVGRGRAGHGPRGARLLGVQRLPHPGGSVEGAAVLERLTPVAQKAPGDWQIGTVTQIRTETPTVKTIRIALPMWMAHLPGQHYEVRLTAPDGYTAQRSYSIASSPLLEGVDRADDRAPAGRRGLDLPARRAPGGRSRSRCAARSRPTSCGAARARCCCSAAARGWCR